MKRAILLLLVSGIFQVLFSQSIDYKGFPEWSWHKQGSTEYYLYTPKNLTPGKKYPVALFMHGCCGTDNVARLRNAVDPPVRMWHEYGENNEQVPMYIIAPATSSGWSQHFGDLKTVMDDIIATKQGDPQRIYVTGFSMGGGGTWDIINTYPTYFAAAIPMGMDFSGSQASAKNIPIWCNRGETCPYSTQMPQSVASIRALNGDNLGPFHYMNSPDGTATPIYVTNTLASAVWERGVNPNFSQFKTIGHGVQWDAVSSQDLVSWALTKINDGNIYPNVFFKAPTYKQLFTQNKIGVEIGAGDNDGTIAKVELYVNGILKSTLTTAPYKDSAVIRKGDNILSAIAYDDKGKTSTSFMIARKESYPVLMTTALPDARQGAIYMKQLFADGNGPFTFKPSSRYTALPAGIILQANGLLKGVPIVSGTFNVGIVVVDEDLDSVVVPMTINVKVKDANEVIVTNARTFPWNSVIISKMMKGEEPNTGGGSEITLSNVNKFAGLTAIFPNVNDATNSNATYLSFDVSDDVIVRVAYEKMDCTLVTTVPSWLNSYTKDNSTEIAAQYRYFDVYSKNFPKGTVALPGADATPNKVGYNYFVMVQKNGTTINSKPEPQAKRQLTAYIGQEFKEQVSALDGEGNLLWSLASGTLPAGMSFNKKGLIQGFPTAKGDYSFTLKVKDANGDSTSTVFSISVKDLMQAIHTTLSDTTVMKNSGVVTIPLKNITNGESPTQNVTIQIIPDNTNLLTLTDVVKGSGNDYSFTFTPKADQVGYTYISVKIKDNNNPDTLTNTSNDVFKVAVLSAVNEAPTCDDIPDQIVHPDNAKHTVKFTGVSDGNGTGQTITVSATATYMYSVINNLAIVYKAGSDTGIISYYPSGVGKSVVTFKLKDNGGTNLGGVDTKTKTFTINVVGDALGNDEDQISLYPNPAKDKFELTIPENIYQSYSLLDLTGRIMASQKITSTKTEINVSAFPAGNYTIVLTGDTKVTTKKLIIVE